MPLNPTTAPVATTAAEALKPCPFCGGRAKMHPLERDKLALIICENPKCMARIGSTSIQQSEDIWNTRVDTQQPQPVTAQSDDCVLAQEVYEYISRSGFQMTDKPGLVAIIAAHTAPLRAEVARLQREVEVLRWYGNKDNTAAADQALGKEPSNENQATTPVNSADADMRDKLGR